MIYVGIDVAKDKHDCFITNSEGDVLFKAFTIPKVRVIYHLEKSKQQYIKAA